MEPKLVLLVAFTAGAFAGPINTRVYSDPNSCASECTETKKFRYEAGTAYEFSYESSTRTTMAGAAEEHAGIRITADVQIEALTSCDMVLMLSDVRLQRSDPRSERWTVGDNSGSFQQALEAYPLRFSYQDGIVEELCPSLDESTWSLNIKRGVLSAFQNSMKDLERDQRVKENDVSGECYTDYRVTQRGWKSSTITKSKDLTGCTHRHGLKTAFHAMPYKMPGAMQSLPVMRSGHECTQTVSSEGLLQTSTCAETHVFRPFSKHNNGAVTEAASSLKFKRTLPYVRNRQNNVESRSALTFEHTMGLLDEELNRRDVNTKLEELCSLSATDIRPELPELFAQLVYTLKNANFRSLDSTYRFLQNGRICASNDMGKKFFIDAIPMIGTVDSLRMMRELINKKAVSEDKKDMWLTSLAFIQNPTAEMITEVQPLMESQKSEKVKLLLAAMVNNFCSTTSSCLDAPVINRIISSLESDINRACVVTPANYNEILISLRALGNIGTAERLSLTLEPCFTREDNPMEIRVAALDAYRRLPCGTDRNNAMQMYLRTDEDSELRIGAYLVAMQCATENTLEQVRATLASEKASQVGSFVWSHLINLQETASPLKQEVKKILEDEELAKEFDLDKRKYSRNYEGSLFSDKLNAGAVVESNVIWSSKSFLPRSAMVNLTVDMFGQSVNLFELGGRVEGLESVLESFLGPEADTKAKANSEGYKDSRSVRKDKLERMKNKYGQTKDDLHASVFLRIFGNELRYMHFDADNWPLSKKNFNFLQFLLKLSKDHDYSFTNNLILMDTSLVIPTCAGLPLNLTVHAASSVNVKANGKVDLREMAASPRSMIIEGQIQPSGAVTVSGSMTVDAFVTRTGLRMVSTVHSSTAVKGRVELSRGQIFNVELDLPRDNMEIVNVKSSFFVVNGDEEREQKMMEENRRTRQECWGDRLVKVTGVEVCGEAAFPNASMVTEAPYFPFTGPVNMAITLNKRDTHTGYLMAVKRMANRDKISGHVSFDTPGSRVNRAVSMDMTLSLKDKTLEAELISPWKQLKVRSNMVNGPERKLVKGSLTIDNKDEYGTDMEVKIERGDTTVTYHPKVLFKKKQMSYQVISGSVTREGVERVNADLDLSPDGMELPTKLRDVKLIAFYANTKSEKLFNATWKLSKKEQYKVMTRADITDAKSKKRVDYSLAISVPKKDLLVVKGLGELRPKKAFKTVTTIEMKTLLKNPIRIKLDGTATEKKRGLKYKGNAEVKSEFGSFKLDSNLDKKKGGAMSGTASLTYSLPKIKENKASLSWKVIRRSGKNYKFNANLDVKRNKEYNMDLEVKMNTTSKAKGGEITFRHAESAQDKKNKQKELHLSFGVNHKISREVANIDYTVHVTYPYKSIKADLKGHHSHDRKNIASTLTVNYGKKQTVNTAIKLRDRTRNKMLNMEGSFELDYPGRDIALVTNLTQKGKSKYLHIINIKLQKGEKSTIVTSYNSPSTTSRRLSSEAVIHGYDPVRFDVSADYPSWKDLQVSAKVTRKEERYGFVAENLIKETSGKWNVEVYLPENSTFFMRVSGGKQGNRYSGEIETTTSPSNRLKGSVSFEKQGSQRVSGNFEIATPLTAMRFCTGEFDYANKKAQVMMKGSAVWGRNKISASASLDKPFKPTDLAFSFAATTPFRNFETLELSLINKFDKSLLTQGKIIAGPHNGQMKLHADYTISAIRRNVDAGFEFKSSMKTYRIVAVSISHQDDGNTYKSGTKYNDNGDIYSADFDATVINTKINFNGKTGLVMSSPNHRITTNLNHEHRPYAIKTVLSTDWGRGKKIMVDVTANYENIIKRKVNGAVKIQTPWEPMNDVDTSVAFEMAEGLMTLNGHAKKDRRTLALVNSKYTRNYGEVDFDVSISGSALRDDITGKLNVAQYTGNPKTAHAEFEWSRFKKVSVDLYLDHQPDLSAIDTNMRLTTPFQGAEDIVVKYSHKKETEEMVTNMAVEFGPRKYVRGETKISIENPKLLVVLDSSFADMQHLELGFEKTGTLKNLRSVVSIELKPHLGKLSGEVEFTNSRRSKSAMLRVDSPWKEFRYMQIDGSHKITRRGNVADLKVEYHPGRVINLNTKYDVKSATDFSVDTKLTTPYPKYPNFEANVSLKKTGVAMEAVTSVKTPFQGYEDITANFNHALDQSSIRSHAEVMYRPGKTITADLYGNIRTGFDGSLTVRTPYENYEDMRVTINHQGKTWRDFSTRTEMQYSTKRIEGDIAFTHNSDTTGSLKISTPYRGLETINAEFSKKGQLNNLKTKAALQYGQRKYEGAVQYLLQGSKFGVGASLKSPWHKDITVTGESNRDVSDLTGKGMVSYGTDYKVDTNVGLKLKNNDIGLRSSVHYLWAGKGNTVGVTLVKEGTLEDFNAEVGGKFNQKGLEVAADFKKGATSRGNLRVTTPFENYRTPSLTFDYNGNAERFVSNTRFNVRDNMEYDATIDFMKQRNKRVEASLDLRTPHAGYQNCKLDYSHSFRRNRFVAETHLHKGGQKWSAVEVDVDYQAPGHAKVAVETPFDGYDRIEASGNYAMKRDSVHEFSATANVGKHGAVSVKSSVDTSGNPYQGEATITTPFKDYENMKVSFSHRGRIENFRTTALINAPKLMQPIDAVAAVTFTDVNNYDGQFTMTSGLKNMEDVRFVVKNSKVGNEYTTHHEYGWQADKRIISDSSFSLREDPRGVNLGMSWSMTTPFRELSNVNYRITHMHTTEKVSQQVTAEYNGKTYVDADFDYTMSGRHEAAINIREPSPMSMSVSGLYQEKQMDANVYINWNTDDLESNIRFESAFNNRSERQGMDVDFRVKMIHPVRVMGVEAAVKRLPDSMQNMALITWDEKKGNTFAYDVQWNNRKNSYRQTRDGSVKLVVPMRSVKVSGSYVNSSAVRSMDAAVMWDADRDQSKQVKVKADLDERGRSVKRSMLINLPSIKKEYKVETSLMRQQGNVLMDGSTVFSYSSDPRDSITMTTKLENLGTGGNNNYSASMGISHPATFTNLLLNTHMGHSITSCSMGLVMSYEARNRDKNYFVLSGQVNRRDKEMQFQASSPLKHVLLTGQMDSTKPYHVTLINRYDHTKVVSTDLTLDTDRRTLDLGFAFDSEDPRQSIHLSAGYVNDSAIQATVFRKSDFKRISESDIAVRLNTSHVLHTRVTWRPAATQELQQFVASKVQVYNYVMNEAADEISQAMGQEVTAKYKKIANEILEGIKPVFGLLEQEFDITRTNLDYLRTELRRAYRRNDLHIRDMGQVVNKAFEQMFGEFGDFVEEFEKMYERMDQSVTQWVQMVKHYPIQERYAQFVEQAVQYLKKSRRMTEFNMRALGFKMEKASDDLYRFYLTQSRALSRQIRGLQASILNHPQIQQLKSTYDDMRHRMSNLPEVDYAQYSKMADEIVQRGLESINMKHSFNKVKAETKAAIQQHINTIKQDPDFQKAQDIGNEIYQQALWAYKYWDLEKSMRETMARLFRVSRDLVFVELNRLKDSMVDLDKSRVIVYDPINGELQFELYLPIPLKSLAEPPDFNINNYVRRVKTFVKRYIPGQNYSVWDTYYKIIPSLDSSQWLPPYKSYASVMGNQHYITFDKSHFEFAGRCNYVLTRDMVDDNFTVVVNYDNNMRSPKIKSLLVMLRGANIEVATDYKVTVNDRPVELPYSVGNVEAVREGHQVIVMAGDGLTVNIDPYYDIYTVGLSGWYHGRVAGLLGTFDNEMTNDMTTSSRAVVSDVVAMASSWEVGRKCKAATNRAVTINDADMETRYPQCVEHFQSQTSHFRRCFSVVSPVEFLRACVGLMEKASDVEEAMCKTAGQYFHQCRTNGVYLQMPPQCVTCKLPTGLKDIKVGEAVQLTADADDVSLPSSADVILVLEEKKSAQWTSATLGNLVLEVESALRSTGVNDNRYGMVGYGGPGKLATEHSRTFDGQLFSKSRSFLKGVENIAYSTSKVPGDGLAALRRATNYPFRTGVAKLLLYIPASDCEAARAQADMEDTLTRHGFVMHLLREKAMDIRDNVPVRKTKVFGMDGGQLLTMKNRQDKTVKKMYENLVQPTDTCAQLALSTNGSIFDTNNMLESSQRVRKQFVRTIAARVALTAAPPTCQTCKCEQGSAGVGKVVCRPCDQSSFVWKYMPNIWWSNNRTNRPRSDVKRQLQDYLKSSLQQSLEDLAA